MRVLLNIISRFTGLEDLLAEIRQSHMYVLGSLDIYTDICEDIQAIEWNKEIIEVWGMMVDSVSLEDFIMSCDIRGYINSILKVIALSRVLSENKAIYYGHNMTWYEYAGIYNVFKKAEEYLIQMQSDLTEDELRIVYGYPSFLGVPERWETQ